MENNSYSMIKDAGYEPAPYNDTDRNMQKYNSTNKVTYENLFPRWIEL